MPQYALLRNDLVASPAEIDGQTVYNIKDPITGHYFRLREPEYWLIRQFDGRTSYDQVAERFREKFQLNIGADDVAGFVNMLESNFFLENSRSEQEISRKSYRPAKRRSLFSRLLFVKIKAFNPTAILDRLVRLYRPFHSAGWLIVQLALIIFGVGLLLANNSHFSVRLYEIFNIGSIVTIVLAFFILMTVHEFSHALICRYYGGEVKELGFLFLYFQPCCYCDLSDAWLFEKKKHRLAVTLAGPYSGLVLLALTVIAWRVTMPGSGVNELAQILGIVIWVTLIFNLNPLIKLDGYYLLSDWLDIPNLRAKSFAYLGNFMKRVILGWPIEPIEASPRERKIYLRYAILAAIYTVALLAWVLWIISGFMFRTMGGAGILLLFAVLFYTIRTNVAGLARGIISHLRYMKDILKRPARLISYILLLVIFVVLVFVIRFPHTVNGEVTVRPIAEYTLRLNNFGLLEKRFRRGGADSESKSSYLQMASTDMASLDLVPKVQDGQAVKPGDTLAVIISNQVSQEIEAEQSLLERCERDLALLRSPPKKEETDEARAAVDAAKASYQQKFRDERRIATLAEKGHASDEELETARSVTVIARAEAENKAARLELLMSPPKPEEEAVILSEIDKQQAKLRFLYSQKDAQSITTPIAGKVVIDYQQNEFLSVVNNGVVEVLVPVSDFDFKLVAPGQRVRLKVRSFTNRLFKGTVVHIPRGAVSNSTNANFCASAILDNEDDILTDGMTGYAKIDVGRASLFTQVMRKIASIIRVEFWSWW